MKVALLVTYALEKEAHDIIDIVLSFFDKHDVQVYVEDQYAEQIGSSPLSSCDTQSLDFLISLGGDGTILTYAHKYFDLDVPILGINIGHLGFMADIPVSDINNSLQDLIKGDYSIEKRLVLEGSNGVDSCEAVNDLVIHRARNPSLIEVSIHADGLYVNTFEADGLILATPNGSTAYSLAAGGPILVPGLEAIVLTPISPHTISNRPLVLSSDTEIEVKYISDYQPIEVIGDGVHRFELATNGSLKIRRSSKNFQLVNLKRRDFYSTLRTKLGWSGKLR